VKCAKCGADNREGRKFCSKCGGALARSCSKCGAANEPGEDFCGVCGTSLSSSSAPGSEPAKALDSAIKIAFEAPSESLDGERKTVTAFFADLAGSTSLMESLDPEETRALVDPALKIMVDAVHRYDG
jgi:Double zinc ribbon